MAASLYVFVFDFVYDLSLFTMIERTIDAFCPVEERLSVGGEGGVNILLSLQKQINPGRSPFSTRRSGRSDHRPNRAKGVITHPVDSGAVHGCGCNMRPHKVESESPSANERVDLNRFDLSVVNPFFIFLVSNGVARSEIDTQNSEMITRLYLVVSFAFALFGTTGAPVELLGYVVGDVSGGGNNFPFTDGKVGTVGTDKIPKA